MHSFHYQKGELYCEQTPVRALAEKHGTPLYVYSRETIANHFLRLQKALSPLDHHICFAVKANSNLAVLRLIANLGGGFDIVSEGELRRVIAAGGSPKDCEFAGVGKTEREIEFALRRGIYSFNIESEGELERIEKVAARVGKMAPFSVRVNPNVDAHTHAKITTGTYENKFGIALERVERVYERASKLKHVRARGLQMHIGSQLTEVAPFAQAIEKVSGLALRLKKLYGIEFFSIGGGLGIVYEQALASGNESWWQSKAARKILTPETYAERLVPLLKPLGLRVVIEPGRFIVGNAGILVTQVQYVKKTDRKRFVIVDAAMNDLVRPAMYDSHHEIVPVKQRNGAVAKADVVGPICESGDRFAKDRELPMVEDGEYLALLSAGAYGFAMASNYNTRAMPAEVLVSGRKAAVVRPRQRLEELWQAERMPSWV